MRIASRGRASQSNPAGCGGFSGGSVRLVRDVLASRGRQPPEHTPPARPGISLPCGGGRLPCGGHEGSCRTPRFLEEGGGPMLSPSWPVRLALLLLAPLPPAAAQD